MTQFNVQVQTGRAAVAAVPGKVSITGYVNLYKFPNGSFELGSKVFRSARNAVKNAQRNPSTRGGVLIGTHAVKVEQAI